jgi:hypothetical protein
VKPHAEEVTIVYQVVQVENIMLRKTSRVLSDCLQKRQRFVALAVQQLSMEAFSRKQ